MALRRDFQDSEVVAVEQQRVINFESSMRGYLGTIDTGNLGRAAGSVPRSFSGELQGASAFPLLGRSISLGEALLSVLEICLQKSKDASGSDSTLMQPSKSPFTPCKGLFAKQ
jgi:hypothetical protein